MLLKIEKYPEKKEDICQILCDTIGMKLTIVLKFMRIIIRLNVGNKGLVLSNENGTETSLMPCSSWKSESVLNQMKKKTVT